MTTATRKPATTFRHLDGCPVERPPADMRPAAREALAARVEVYTAVPPRLNDGNAAPMTVTHCIECGATAYEKEQRTL